LADQQTPWVRVPNWYSESRERSLLKRVNIG